MAEDNPLERAVPRVRSDTSRDRMTQTKGKLYWRVHNTDDVVTFPKLPPTTQMLDLGMLMRVYDSTFAPEIKGRNRDRLQMQALIASWGNDVCRADGRGAFKHSWPLVSLHDGNFGNSADQTFDIPIFFADVEWSEPLKEELASHTPLQRLRDSHAFNPLLWHEPTTPTLRIRVLRPVQTRGTVMEFRFVITDASRARNLPGNNTVVILCIGCALLWTTVDEMLRCKFLPAPSTTRKAVLKWIDGFSQGGKASYGPVLIYEETEGDRTELVWLFQPGALTCKRWAQDRLIGELEQPDLGGVLLSRMRDELAKGPSGLALDWATHYDSITPGY